MKNIGTKINPKKTIGLIRVLIIFIILGLLGASGYFLYKNFYQVVSESEEVSKLKRNISIESVDIKTFESVTKKLKEKQTLKDVNTIKDPFK